MLRRCVIFLCLFLTSARISSASSPLTNFVNFETAPVHPVALSPDATTLAVCNLPDGRLELFQAEDLAPLGSIPVGLDPVSVRFRGTNELWVLNHISDSINVVDLAKRAVVRLISTRDGPASIVFAGEPERAFVSCPPENVVLVFDPTSGALVRTIDIPAERPRALAVSPDGHRVYAAVFESGNGTTIIAPRMIELTQFPVANPIDLFSGPYGGLNPPPNRGNEFVPPLSTNLPPGHAPPRVSLIVKKQSDGRWLDDNSGDWTQFISGTNAAYTGRVPGWTLLDHDVVAIDAATFELSFVDGLMNICMDLAVNPATGTLAVIGTEALNHLRY